MTDRLWCEDDGDGFCYVHLHWLGDEPDSDDEPTQCAGLSGECPNPPLPNGYCTVHQSQAASLTS